MSTKAERWGMVCVVAAVGIVIAVGAWLGRGFAEGGPRRPRRDTEVLARVPARARDAAAAAREALARRLRAKPDDLPAALELARIDIAAARKQGDPRFLGRAEAVLARWSEQQRPPRDVLLLRATVRQSRHEFDGALADLDRVLAESPDEAQAWLTRAVVLGVRGRHADGLASCERLRALASPFVVAACRAPLLGVTGRARAAADELAGALAGAATAGERAWGLSLLGELASWMGDERGAEASLRAALALDPDDRYTRAALAELLRGEQPPAADAVAAAREHWRLQREPADARVLLEAAAAADDATAAAPVLAWLDETGFEWPRLRALAARLRGRS